MYFGTLIRSLQPHGLCNSFEDISVVSPRMWEHYRTTARNTAPFTSCVMSSGALRSAVPGDPLSRLRPHHLYELCGELPFQCSTLECGWSMVFLSAFPELSACLINPLLADLADLTEYMWLQMTFVVGQSFLSMLCAMRVCSSPGCLDQQRCTWHIHLSLLPWRFGFAST